MSARKVTLDAVNALCEKRATTADEEAKDNIAKATDALERDEPDEAIGFLLDAVMAIGEARGIRNTAVDILEGES